MALRSSLGVIASVLRNRRIAAVELAYVGFSLVEWTIWIAMLVYAYGVGGAREVGLAVFIQLVPSAILAPLAAVLGDRYRRDRMLVLAYVLQGASVIAVAAALSAGAAVLLVYLLAAVANSTITLTRPLQAALLPSLAETPAQLTAANVTSGLVQNAAILVGPGLCGVGLAVAGPGLVFGASGTVMLAAALVVAFAVLRIPHPAVAVRVRRSTALTEIGEGLAVLARRGRPRTVLGLFSAAELVWGMLDLLVVVLALDILRLGEPSVGYLNAIFGVGGVTGSAVAVSLIGRPRLALPFGMGVVAFGAPIALLGLVSGGLAAVQAGSAVAAALLLVAGAGRSVLDVAGRTLLQRVAPHRMLARVFGIVEGVDMASLATGSVVAALALAVLGPRLTFVLAGLALPVVVAVTIPSLREIDMAAEVHLRELDLLRRVPMFAPLPALVLERLAASVIPAHAEAGDAIVTQGEPGDRYYVLASGQVEVLIDGRLVRTLGPGDGFGEIALLRSVPRTATVRALTEVELIALEREPFLEAVTGYPQSHAAAESLVRERLSPASQ